MKTTTPLSRHVPWFAGIFVLAILALSVSGCTVSTSPAGMQRALVNGADPVFDKRFHDLTFDDIDTSGLWIERGMLLGRGNLVIHNNTFSDLVDDTRNAVVNIYTTRVEERKVNFGLSPNDILPFRIPVISDIFDIIPFKVPIPYRAEGFSLGSGFIISEQGYILTNAHVINNATDIRVFLSEKQRDYPAKIVGADRLTDTALIKIEPDHFLSVVPLGNSDKLRVGEMVLAMGNPFGLRHSATSGIVSATERVSPGLNRTLVDFIQTDSAINPGSSGGPLLNLYGEVVGINTAMVSHAQSIGFAIPINTVKEVIPMLVLGQPERGWFGVKAVPLTPQKAAELRYPEVGGILVLEVEKGSPAEEGGVRPGDIIVELDGLPLTHFVLFRRKLIGLIPGQKIQIKVYREGKTLEITSVLGKAPSGK
ncbi:MAG: trypsin-like peptidase domain-containing protein [Deltaproteobacteria bacterium]|nr:trypsin-like peptidase domain-containing protein [Deltaproteobacteria bacterium]MBW2047935.1 trypsin-like peptidase domain-containing protein [Deltaproteobacteria bacterium]MBW2112335.1 trypsin-like peptidase domain-containing protein [Deltaproteobacteria bacterium]MBW2352981.1 trypsin-like peptidase domain-containing protein [Deltaproteobacteria bacterium]HDZ89373.1 trypsin-like serine protease [Deltaproteobacteria bacterium]